MTSSARERRYQAAFREYFVCAHTGTPYPCSQRDINETYDFSQDNQRALVSATRANREIVEHNEPRRPISSRERDAGRRILSALDEARLGHWGPDLITKCFLDLDTVFFGGVLRGNVRMDWDTWEQHIRPGDLGATGDPEPGRADIHLNAKMILLNHAEPLEAMFTVILHEMCHAYVFVRVRTDEVPSGEGHDANFWRMIRAVYTKAMDELGMVIVATRLD